MAGKIFTPVNQVKFTNVAVVRLKKGGTRFEVACYKNKVVEYRKKIETDLDQVLQSQIIYTNLSKGIIAKKQELKKGFGSKSETEIAKEILDKGQVQVSGKERQQEYETLFRDIATIVAEKCVNPETNRPLTVGLVERAMKDIHYSVVPSQSAKKQALDVIKRLQAEKPDFPIARANMRLKFTLPSTDVPKLKEEVGNLLVKTEEERSLESGTTEIIAQINPSSYRNIDQIVRKVTSGKGSLEVVTLSVSEQTDQKIN